MHITKSHITPEAHNLLRNSNLANQAYDEVVESINNMVGYINNSSKNCNGVVPVKEGCYQLLEETYGWYREKPLDVLSAKGGPIDVYKDFYDNSDVFSVGIEFETGNISSAHRAMNKLALGVNNSEIHLAILLFPVSALSYYLTDRVSNYEELEPYFSLVDGLPFIFLGFDAEDYSPTYPLLPKGKDGMSPRATHKWKDR